MAMAVGKNRHYVVDEIFPRHFFQTAKASGVSQMLLHELMDEFVEMHQQKLDQVIDDLPKDFPDTILGPIIEGIKKRVLLLSKKENRDA
jgi:serine/threonine-protein kinase HipA